MKFLVVDDSKVFAAMFRQMLEDAGHEVEVELDSTQAIDRISAGKPDCVLLDIMMPNVDGLTVLRQIRKELGLAIKVIIVTAKAYDTDKQAARALGATGYINKVSEGEHLLERIEEIMSDQPKISFWGVRGTLPVSGPKSLRYGGNTSCVSLEFAGGPLFIFDAGSGIKAFSDAMMRAGPKQTKAKIFISHPHFDHIQALPFFGPLYIKGNDFEIFGAEQKGKGIRELIAGQMDGTYFPVTVSEFAAHVEYRNIGEGSFDIDGVKVRTMLLNHPGHCLAYRVDYAGSSFCYATDNELYPQSSQFYNEDYRRQLIEFVRDVDYWVTDTTYTDKEYAAGKEHWGHSTVSEVVKIAHHARVRTLCLFHHDPDQDDTAIDAKLEGARAQLRELMSATQVIAPAEGDSLRLKAKAA